MAFTVRDGARRRRVRRWRLGRWELRRVEPGGLPGEQAQWELALWRTFAKLPGRPELEGPDERCMVALRWYGWPRQPWMCDTEDRIAAAYERRGRSFGGGQRAGRLVADGRNTVAASGLGSGAGARLMQVLPPMRREVFVDSSVFEPGDLLSKLPGMEDAGLASEIMLVRAQRIVPGGPTEVILERGYGGTPQVRLHAGTMLTAIGRA